jgi:hypothetical protein
MKTIPLTQDQVAIVDDEDYEWLSRWKWYAHWDRHTKSFYATRQVRLPNGKWITLLMHRAILGLEHGDKREGDHINHDTLDQRRSNLRIVTCQENHFNLRDTRGFYWDRHKRKFRAQIRCDGKKKHLGYYETDREASASYLAVKAKLHVIENAD